ncbi:hypothetical protein A3K34_01720 [candidate division WWE3 bacterium RIFOXYC1_FULL_40_10]|uniref:Major facilitator superfamily (MFS) profile domain-containing protein n=1 Tax=candidate division WWE3 bacterium RIFOXYA2_FULL_46_9 TaxID=1802636 RepID=A0A1F4W2I3_UNCKA|nr:MAG: hypothetical protein A3K58_01720 [candidate division WWE3 bacterium RIFOXYB1_FULL_40_22]OGC61582.1 MAG: hypothetical protein A3K37_01720 [candidate division WWE3 bacterium RIFOXYA1_FULL_40_11]OGC63629.1 MAG: hypothetical protein A2264_04665 [candidate division WWE3 bacterium RIFOXYA2_FULL_46_9]OGC64740.1 MAG: hypothetical protein A2326_01730 [candidate division WWE3 bacterium RIFOXYB2_FULL_41_6]OGC65965.1 MAG: hypothetical protein A3K34_01720 [candidate division WWE3 bacterium RIFOXYC1_
MNVVKPAKKFVVSKFAAFCIIIFFVSLSDGIMSYVSPIYIESQTANAFLTGIVLSISSFFGILVDFYLSEHLWNKDYKFFLYWMLIFAFLFPLVLVFFNPQFLVFVLAMAFWSIYYELRGYASFDFIHKKMGRNKHTYAWGVISTILSISYALGPTIAPVLLTLNMKISFITSVAMVFTGLAFFILFFLKHNKNGHSSREIVIKKSFWGELQILKTLLSKTWLLISFQVAQMLIDVVFWTTGIIFAANLGKIHPWGAFLITAYTVPFVIVGFFVDKIPVKMGKKRAAFYLSIGAGITMIMLAYSKNVPYLLAVAGLCSILYGIASIYMSAVMEDYIARLGHFGNDMATLSQLSANIAYAFGPIVFGFIAQYMGLETPFVVTGILLIFLSVLCLAYIPRKIRMPQKELISLAES